MTDAGRTFRSRGLTHRGLRWRPMAVLAAFFCVLPGAHLPGADEVPNFWLEDPELVSALRAMEDGLPMVAARRLGRLMHEEDPESPARARSGEQQQWIARLRFQAQVLSGQSSEALVELQRDEFQPGDWDDWPFWHGHALAETGRFELAAERLADVPTGSAHWAEANLARGSLLRSLGRTEEAESILAQVADSGSRGVGGEAALMLAELRLAMQDPDGAAEALLSAGRDETVREAHVEYLGAKVDLSLGRNAEAADRFARILDRWTEGLLAEASLMGLARLKGEDGLELEAAEILLRSLEQRPDTRLSAPMAQLAVRFGALDDPEMRPRMERLAGGEHPAGWQVRWQLARKLATRPDAAEEAHRLFQNLAASNASPRLRQAAMEMRLGLYLSADQWQAAEQILTELSGSVWMLPPHRREYHEAAIQFAKGSDTEAWAGFRSLAQSSATGLQPGTPRFLQFAAANALALAAVVASEQEDAADLLVRVARGRERADDPAVTPDGLLEAGLALASQREAGASALLERFLAEAPDHDRAVDAWIALAEIHLLAFPPRAAAAGEALESGRGADPGPRQLERLDFLAVWAAAAGEDRSEMASRAVDFLERHPDSPRRAEIRMKLAESYYRSEDFANAAAQFKLAAEENAPPELTMAALLFAGRASAALLSSDGLDEAIELWQVVADGDGPLAVAARIQQASALRRLSRWDDALEMNDLLLAEPERMDAAQKAATLCARGQLLMAAGAADSLGMTREQALSEAETSLNEVLQVSEAPIEWRHEARYRLSRIERERGNWAAALELCHEIMRPSDAGASGGPVAYEWFVRAGYEAMDILESRQDWRAALAIAERIAAVPGNRSQDARDRANRMRLEHFIWDER